MFRTKAYTWIGLAAVVVAASSAFAAPAWFVRTWQSDAGLPDNTVIGIEQTPDGFLWVATQTGVVRFDGLQFQELPIQVPGMMAGTVHAICADRRGRVWVAKERGTVLCVDQGKITVVLPPDNAKSDRRVRLLLEDGEGSIWGTFATGEVFRLKDGRVRFFTAEDGLPQKGSIELTVDQKGELWFLRSPDVGVFRDGKFSTLSKAPFGRLCAARGGGVWICTETTILKYTEAEGLSETCKLKTGTADAGPIVLFEDHAGRLWVGTRLAGLFCHEGTNIFKVDTAQQTILCINEDRQGNLWVGTRGGGLKQLKPRVAELLTTSTSPPFDGVQSICKDTNGVLWAVTWYKGTVLRNVDGDWIPLSASDGWTIDYAKCVAADPLGGVWIGTSYSGLYHWKEGEVTHRFCSTNGLAGNFVTALRTTPSGAVWMGGLHIEVGKTFLQCLEAGQLRSFKLPSGCGVVSAIEVDSSGDCWAATAKGMLLRVSGSVVTDETQKVLPRESYAIRSLLATPDNSLWIGFSGTGLGRLKKGRFDQFRMEHGLNDNYISQILSDGRGRLWLAGNRGIFSVREKDLNELAAGQLSHVQSVVYKQKVGLPGLQASYDAWPGALRDAEGRLFFAMQSGVATLYAADIPAEAEPPSVIIDRVLVDHKVVALYGSGKALSASNNPSCVELGAPNAHLHLPPGRRQIEFFFTTPCFTMPESIRFKYQLKGMDKEWIEASGRRSAFYSQLTPGNYQFQVSACNRDGVWNQKGASLALTVAPFWWETAWFRIVGPLMVFGLIGGFVLLWFRRRYHFQIERLELLRSMEKERGRIAADLHDEIGANLTHISILSTLAAKPGTELSTSRQHNAEVTSVARQTILAFDEILWSVNPKNDTLKSLSHFICRRTEEILAPAKVHYHFSLDEALPDSPVSPQRRHGLLLAVKEALHNILKHAGATRVEVKCVIEQGLFVVIVSDNGCGFDPAALPVSVKGRNGHGLANMRRRLEDLGGECRIERQPEGGTRIIFRLPME
jgi:ligand-binding sensor domain-containing protein/signal transduction histidine kinase